MKLSRCLLGAAAVAAMAVVPGVAAARTVAAFDGIPATPSEASCWSHWYGTMTNNCSTTKNWCVPATVDASGSYTMTVWAYAANTSANVGCYAVGVNRETTTQWSSSTIYLSSFGSAQPITLTGAYIPGNGGLFACCNVGPGGRINTVTW